MLLYLSFFIYYFGVALHIIWQYEPWKKKERDSTFDVTMDSYDGAEACELIGIYILSLLGSTLQNDLMGLYWGDGLIIFRNTNN